MEHGFIDRYSGLVSPVHRLDPRTKILAVLLFVILVASTPPQHLLAFVCYAGLLLWAAAFSHVPLRHIVSHAALVLPFSGLVALGLPFLSGGEAVTVLGTTVSVKGLWLLSGTLMKSFLGAAALVLLISTTSFSVFLSGLRHLRTPALFTDLLSLMYRYLFVFLDESLRLKRAAAARGYKPSWLHQAKGVGYLAGKLFLRSYERSERIYGAMILRGYDSRMPSAALGDFSVLEGTGLVFVCVLLAVIRVFAK
ncbi:MAG: cobalt ECF transporter T component CbiQ [Alphaproteobacteria bacterium]|nr:cobalt ECF transporter T component CbiQ [Alphaproteobacteria bacterium]